jgi:hypothetical protein
VEKWVGINLTLIFKGLLKGMRKTCREALEKKINKIEMLSCRLV